MADFVKDNGDGTGTYSDGSVRYLAGNPGGKRAGSLAERHPKAQIITSETAAELLKRRRELRVEAAVDAIAGHPDARGDLKLGMGIMFDAQMVLASSPDMGQASTRAAGWLLQQAKLAEEDAAPIVAVQVVIGDRLVGAYGGAGDVVDVKAVDVAGGDSDGASGGG